MQEPRDVYYLSGSTGILAKDLGKALLCQFPDVPFREELIPFIQTEKEAEKAIERIRSRSTGQVPMVISTLLGRKLNGILNHPDVEFLNIFDQFLRKIEDILEEKAVWKAGASRHPSERTMIKRVEAIHYCIDHDDGSGTKDYDEAEVILLGVSRSGKTPVSVYLATQMGIKTANYPLVLDDSPSFRLPPYITRNKKRLIGLSITPQLLHQYREQRYANSSYASLSTCRSEINEVNTLYLNHDIPIVTSDGKSIEEIAIHVTQLLNLKKKAIL
jgi:[pyruvate, water dikinase]-phosphate phosphotransferase / [pyruvate, water dikinase] kinase